MENQEPKLYTCIMKCAMCLRELGVAYHVPKTPGTRMEHKECPDHKPLEFVLEWQAEEQRG